MKIIGHRGAMGHEPENTLRSFKKAIELGATGIELDVYNVEDKLVVFHDKKLKRTTNGSGSIYNRSVTQLRALDAGLGERIPFLEEVIDNMPLDIVINIELKGKGTALPVAKLIENYPLHKFVVSSFSRRELKKFQLVSSIPIGVLLSHRPIYLKRLIKSFPNAISFNLSLGSATRAMVEHIHSLGYQVWVWTVNKPEDIARMQEIGVDAIFTDYPDRVPKFSMKHHQNI